MSVYRCLECGEEFEFKSTCINHHFDTKHQKFEIIGTDAKFNIRS